MLAKLGFSHIVNTAAVRFIEDEQPHPKTGQERCKVTFMDGTTLLIDGDLDTVERTAGQIVPAPPGYSIVRAYAPEQDEDDFGFEISPVIAFRTMADRRGQPMPIAPDGEPDRTWALIYPDGRCDAVWDQTFASVDAFKAGYRKMIEEQR